MEMTTFWVTFPHKDVKLINTRGCDHNEWPFVVKSECFM